MKASYRYARRHFDLIYQVQKAFRDGMNARTKIFFVLSHSKTEQLDLCNEVDVSIASLSPSSYSSS